jgi:hypothetical protein
MGRRHQRRRNASSPPTHPRPHRRDRPPTRRPVARQQWDELSSYLGLTRAWLDTTDRLAPLDLPSRGEQELWQRRDQLDQIFDSAPPDWRPTISAIRSGQLTLDEPGDLLQSALAGQHARHDWILQHWLHIVEFAEIDIALDAITADPEFNFDQRRSAEFDDLSDGVDL